MKTALICFWFPKTCESNANENVESDTFYVRFDIIVRWAWPRQGYSLWLALLMAMDWAPTHDYVENVPKKVHFRHFRLHLIRMFLVFFPKTC